MNNINILCFLWGKDWCNGRGVEYVVKLYRGVHRNTTYPVQFTCMVDSFNHARVTDALSGFKNCDVLLLDSPSWLGCLPKLNAYNPSLQLSGKVLVMDLDCIIVGSIDPMIDAIVPDKLITRAWFGGLKKGVWLSGGDMIGFYANSEVTARLWNAFYSDPLHIGTVVSEGGRERYVYRKSLGSDEIDYWQRVVPWKVLSYKWHCIGTTQRPRHDTAVVSCHGDPRPHKIREEWLKKCWA